MDELARRYLLLGLRLERISPGFLDSYNGPPDLSEVAASGPTPLAAELHDEAMALRAMAGEMLGADGPELRGRWMDGQLRAMAALARRAGGEEIAYVDLVEQLYGVPIGPVPESELLAARDRLDAALPGAGSLTERVTEHRARMRVAPDKVLEAVTRSAARFRTITLRDYKLPADEGIDWEEEHDQPWGAYATFVGNGTTRILINVDLPVDVAGVAYLASHEAYPGHHAEHAMKEQTLVARGVGEATLRSMNTPESMMAEGQADVAREVVMSDRELESELAQIGSEVGITADWPRAVAIHRAMSELSVVPANAALMLHHAGRPEADVRAWVMDIAPLDGERIEHLFRALNDPVGKTYFFTYTEGARLIRSWLEVVGQTTGFGRLLSEQLSPAQLQDEIATASVAGQG